MNAIAIIWEHWVAGEFIFNDILRREGGREPLMDEVSHTALMMLVFFVQRGNQESRVSGAAGSVASSQPETGSAFSPAEFLGQASIGPLSESDEEDEEEDSMGKRNVLAKGYKFVFERDCTELDLNLIEEN